MAAHDGNGPGGHRTYADGGGARRRSRRRSGRARRAGDLPAARHRRARRPSRPRPARSDAGPYARDVRTAEGAVPDSLRASARQGRRRRLGAGRLPTVRARRPLGDRRCEPAPRLRAAFGADGALRLHPSRAGVRWAPLPARTAAPDPSAHTAAEAGAARAVASGAAAERVDASAAGVRRPSPADTARSGAPPSGAALSRVAPHTASRTVAPPPRPPRPPDAGAQALGRPTAHGDAHLADRRSRGARRGGAASAVPHLRLRGPLEKPAPFHRRAPTAPPSPQQHRTHHRPGGSGQKPGERRCPNG